MFQGESSVPRPLPRRIKQVHLPITSLSARLSPRVSGWSACASSLSRPARASHNLRPAGLLDRLWRPLSRDFNPASYPAKSLVSDQICRQLSGWILPPLAKRAIGAHWIIAVELKTTSAEFIFGASGSMRRRSVRLTSPGTALRRHCWWGRRRHKPAFGRVQLQICRRHTRHPRFRTRMGSICPQDLQRGFRCAH